MGTCDFNEFGAQRLIADSVLVHLVHHLFDEVMQVESAISSDGNIDKAAVPDNHQRMLRMKIVLTLKCGVKMSQRFIAE